MSKKILIYKLSSIIVLILVICTFVFMTKKLNGYENNINILKDRIDEYQNSEIQIKYIK